MPQGICQLYTGSTCEAFLKNQTVFVPPHLTLDSLEDNLKAAYYGVIKESKDMNPNCRGYALPSLCYSVLPICKTPEKTNHQYFRNIALEKEKERLRAAAAHAAQILATTIATTTSSSTSKATILSTIASINKETTTVTANFNSNPITIPSITTATKIIDVTANSMEKPTTMIDSITTVKPRLKKSQKSRNKKGKTNLCDCHFKN